MLDSRIRFPWLQDKHCDVSRSGAATLTAYRFLSEVLVQGNPCKGFRYFKQEESSVGIGLAALLALFSADLALWRLLLIESTANRNEGLQVGDIARRCGLCGRLGESYMAEVLSALCCSTSNESKASAIYTMRDSERTFSPDSLRAAHAVFSRYFAVECKSMSDRHTIDSWREMLM